MSTPTPLDFGRPYRRMLLGVVAAGAVVQLLLAAYFLGVVHEPTPRDLPVGVVPSSATQVTEQLESSGSFDVTTFDDTDALAAAIEAREVYGGFVVTADGVQPWTATAAGSLPASVLRATAVRLNTAEGASADPTAAHDVVTLPTDDSNGSSIGAIMQVLSLGGSIASLALGRLVPRVPRSLRRGLGHTGALVAYALVSSATLLWVSSWYGVGADASHGRLFLDYALVSLAFTASTAGFVALLGPAGALSGAVYFVIGTTISGATLPWEFLPSVWATVGAWLPTGGGAHLLRSIFYFPEAANGAAYLCLGLYAGLGALVILVTNTVRNRHARTSAMDVDLVSAVAGPKVEEPDPPHPKV